jgi:hypothetical protein
MRYLAFLVLYFSVFVAFAQPENYFPKLDAPKPLIFVFERAGKQIIYEPGDMIVYKTTNERKWKVGFVDSIAESFILLIVDSAPIRYNPTDITAVKHKKYRKYGAFGQAAAGVLPVAAIGYPITSFTNNALGPGVLYTSMGLMIAGIGLQLVYMPKAYKQKNGWRSQIVRVDGIYYRTKLSGYDKP